MEKKKLNKISQKNIWMIINQELIKGQEVLLDNMKIKLYLK